MQDLTKTAGAAGPEEQVTGSETKPSTSPSRVISDYGEGESTERGANSVKRQSSVAASTTSRVRGPRDFLDLPGEIRTLIYDELARHGELGMFSTCRQVRNEAAAVSGDNIWFDVSIEYWKFGECSTDHIPALGRATPYIQDVRLTINMDNYRDGARGRVPYCPRRIEFFGGSDIPRGRCYITLDYMETFMCYFPEKTKGLAEYEVYKSLGTLTGFEYLMIRIESTPLWDLTFKGWKERKLKKLEEIKEVLEQTLGPCDQFEEDYMHGRNLCLDFEPLEYVRGD